MSTQGFRPGWFSDPLYSPNLKVARLRNASGQSRIGPHMVLKVMAGDSYNLRVAAGWESGNASNSSPAVLTELTGVAGASGGKVAGGELQAGSGSLNGALSEFLSGQTTSGTYPKAYLCWVLLDEQFRVARNSSGEIIGSGYSGFEQVGAGGSAHVITKNGLSVAQSGYLFIYTSNEATNMTVFFDNLQVTHIRGPVLEETHYYPFGLTMAGISSKALAFGEPENRYKYNGIEQNNDFDLNMYDAFYRNLDPQIGRFWQIDPKPNETFSSYAAMANNPILFNDILGDTARGVNTTSAQRALDAAKGAFNGIEGGDAVTALFKLADDGVSFANIDKDAFAAAYDGLGSDEAKALAAGYYNLINSSETQFIAMLKDGESLDLSGAQGMTKDLKSLVSKMGIKEGSSAADATGEGGQTVYSKNDGQGLSVISMNPIKKIDAVVTGTNGKKSNVSYIPSVSFILTHEVIGHGLAGQAFKTIPNYYDRAQANYGASVQVNNVYYKAHGMNYYDNGSGHMPLTPSNQRQPMETNRTIGIPSFLKFIR